MVPEPFTIDVDRRRKFIRFHFCGFWTPEVLATFDRAYAGLAPSLGWCDGEHRVLAELSEFAIQSKEVFATLSANILHDPIPPRRFALVSAQPLARLQFRRVIVRDSIRMFASSADAERWLFEHDAPST